MADSGGDNLRIEDLELPDDEAAIKLASAEPADFAGFDEMPLLMERDSAGDAGANEVSGELDDASATKQPKKDRGLSPTVLDAARSRSSRRMKWCLAAVLAVAVYVVCNPAFRARLQESFSPKPNAVAEQREMARVKPPQSKPPLGEAQTPAQTPDQKKPVQSDPADPEPRPRVPSHSQFEPATKSLPNDNVSPVPGAQTTDLSDADQQTPVCLGMVAAAHAKSGNYTSAITTVRKALALAIAQHQTKLAKSLRADLLLYKRQSQDRGRDNPPDIQQPVVETAGGSRARLTTRSVAPASTYPSRSSEIREALARFKKGDFDGAAAVLERAKRQHPELPPAQVLMSYLFISSNQETRAWLALKQAVAACPQDPEAYVLLGLHELRERNISSAESYLARAEELLRRFPLNPPRGPNIEKRMHDGLAAVAEIRQDWKEAQTHLEILLGIPAAATDKNPAAVQAQTMQRLARAIFWQGNVSEALAKLHHAYRIDPVNLLPAEVILGQLYEQRGEQANAARWMNIAAHSYSTNERALIAVATWELKTGQTDRAFVHGQTALGLDPKSLEARLLCGIVALFRREYAQAQRYFEEAHLQSPSNFAATNNLALALCEQANPAKRRLALDYANANFQQNPRNPQAASTLGWVSYKMGNLDQAEKVLREVANSGKLSADAAYYLAQVLYDRGRKKESKELIESVFKWNRSFWRRSEAETLRLKLKSGPDLLASAQSKAQPKLATRSFSDREGASLPKVGPAKLSTPPPEYRLWTDISGEYRTEAAFVRLASGKATLQRPDGSTIQVPLKRLSTKDRQWIENREKGRVSDELPHR